MTLNSQGRPARNRSVHGHNTGTATENVYTCPANCIAEVVFIHIVNCSVTTNTVTVEWYVATDASAANILSTKSLTSTSSHVSLNGINLVLQSGDRIQVTPTNSGSIDTIVTVTEMFIP